MTFPWTDQIVERLKQLYADGWSLRQIALDFGTTRNTVLGKIHRLGLPGRAAATPVKPAKPKPPAAPKPQGLPQAIKMRAAAQAIAGAPYADPRPLHKEAFTFSGGVSLYDHKIGQCRWPNDGVGPAFRFCGSPTIDPKDPGCPYCQRHTLMARPVEKKKAA